MSVTSNSRPIRGATRSLPAGVRRTVWGVLPTVCVFAGVTYASSVLDGINRDATPAFANNTYTAYGQKDVGWYYTPTFDYRIDGISSDFLPLGNTFNNGSTVKTLTVQIQTERPVNSGIVLGQGNFDVQIGTGGYAGSTFAPVLLHAGTTYFVDLLNVTDVGINLATWTYDGNGNPQPAGGATVNLGAYYRNAVGTDNSFATVGPAYGMSAGLNVAGGEPILFFSGTTLPEPSTIGLAGISIAGLIRRRR